MFETGRIRGEVRAAQSAVVVAEAELAAAARAVTLAVEQALLAAEAAIGQRAQFRTAVIARAERLVELTTLGYQAGELNLLDVLDARRRLAESRMEAAALDEAVIAALLELERAVGRPLPERRPDVAVLGPPVPAAVLTPTKMAGGVR